MLKPVADRLLQMFDEIPHNEPCNDWVFAVEKELVNNNLLDDEMKEYIRMAKLFGCGKASNAVRNIVAKLKVL